MHHPVTEVTDVGGSQDRICLRFSAVFGVPFATHANFTCLAATNRLLLQFEHPVTKVTEVGGSLHFMANRAFEEPEIRRAAGALKISTSHNFFAHVLAVLCLVANEANEYFE